MRRGCTFQRASTDISISDFSVELSPTIMNRFSDDSGWSMTGALATFGRACDWVSRSATTWRALRMSVPGSNIMTIDDRPASDFGLDLVEERDAVEQVRLERDRDELLDLLGRQSERLGLDFDGRGRELGQRHRPGQTEAGSHRSSSSTPAMPMHRSVGTGRSC